MNPSSLLPIALEAVALGSALATKARPETVVYKNEKDPVTEVDVAVERTVRDFLRTRTPDIAFLGEEEGLTGSGDLMWALDPIDGTVNFAHGLPMCAVSLGLVREGTTSVLGVVDLPFLGERYYAAEGAGAFDIDGNRLVHRPRPLAESLVAIGDFAYGDGADERNAYRFGFVSRLVPHIQRVRILGSAVTDLACLAAGKVDAVVLYNNTPWDMAAGSVICREAGLTVADHDGTPHTMRSKAIVAGGAETVASIVDLLSER
ncbi:inositol monophosphatase family protein [Longispora albida]|uniref:inositol monophosphatase family protein n=1 Tax=Longispora albida TaxID=203523 RepID=UPI000364D392|nr:inositol monophosphatase family protein [Longispora albida]